MEKTITKKEEAKRILSEIEKLMLLDPEPDSDTGLYLNTLVELLQEYEKRVGPLDIDPPF